MSDEVRRALQRIQAPDEIDAQRRAWALVRASFDAREPVSWQRRNRRPLLVGGRSRSSSCWPRSSRRPAERSSASVRDAVTPDEHTSKPKPALTVTARRRLAPRQLEQRARGSSIPTGRSGGSGPGGRAPGRRTRSTSRSRARTRSRRSTPDGTTRWALDAPRQRPRRALVARAPERGCRIAYLNGRQLRVVAGDGTGDARAAERRGHDAARVAARLSHELAFSTIDGRIELVRRDSAKTIWRSASRRPADPARLVGGRPAPARPRRALAARVRRDGNKLWAIGLPGRAVGRRLRPQEPPVHDDPLLAGDRRSDSCCSRPRPPRRAALPLLRAGRLRDARDVAERQVAARRLGQRGPVALPAAERRPRRGGLEHRRAVRRLRQAPLEKAFPKSVSWCCPASP